MTNQKLVTEPTLMTIHAHGLVIRGLRDRWEGGRCTVCCRMCLFREGRV